VDAATGGTHQLKRGSRGASAPRELVERPLPVAKVDCLLMAALDARSVIAPPVALSDVESALTLAGQ
jgi:hypothetical protein